MCARVICRKVTTIFQPTKAFIDKSDTLYVFLTQSICSSHKKVVPLRQNYNKTMTNVTELIERMTAEEIKTRLAEYMERDERLKEPPLIAVEVRPSNKSAFKCRYEVLLINKEGDETPIKFPNRCSQLIYIYTLLHPKGYQRRKAEADNYRALRHLDNLLYFRDSKAIIKSIENQGFDHFFSQGVAQSRKALRDASPLAEAFVIDHPQSHNGKLLIPFASNGGNVIIHPSLLNTTTKHYNPSLHVQER